MEPTQYNQPVQTVQKAKSGATAKDFFVNLGVFVVLYTLVGTFLTFMFSVINSVFPDTRDIYNYYDPYGSSMRLSVSILIVATPLLIYLLRIVHKTIAEDPAKKDIWVRRWGLYLTLFLAIIMLAVDVVTFINSFLGGETATRFIWKVVLTLIVGVILVWYTRADLKNKFSENRKLAQGTSWAFLVIIVATIIFGFTLIGSPTTIRNIRDDNQRESDLSVLNSRITNYYQSKNGTLPETLAAINLGDPYANMLPKDPETKMDYKYVVVKADAPYTTGQYLVATSSFAAFKLCANFAEDSEIDKRLQGTGGRGGGMTSAPALDYSYGYYEGQFQKHPAGEHCFDVSIDPQRYPPYDPKPRY